MFICFSTWTLGNNHHDAYGSLLKVIKLICLLAVFDYLLRMSMQNILSIRDNEEGPRPHDAEDGMLCVIHTPGRATVELANSAAIKSISNHNRSSHGNNERAGSAFRVLP